MAGSNHESWPDLPYDAWRDTRDTLHLWTQVVGKIRLALTPWLNHSWHVPFYVTARGLTTSPIYYGHRSLEIAFDFNEHALDFTTSDGINRRKSASRPRSQTFPAKFPVQLLSVATGRTPPTMPNTSSASGGC